MHVAETPHPMPIPVDQLKAQRELVKRHLDWLDARIAEESGACTAPSPPVAQAEDASGLGAGTEVPELQEAHVDALLEAHRDQSGLPQSAKIGCVALAVAFIVAFMALLFVLPKFLYDKKSGGPDAAPDSSEMGEPGEPVPFKEAAPAPVLPEPPPGPVPEVKATPAPVDPPEPEEPQVGGS